MDYRRGALTCFLFLALLLGFMGNVSAVGLSLNDVNSTFTTASISSASNLYAYEAAFDYTGTVTASSSSSGFLSSDGSSASYGSSTRDGVLTVYESRLDSTQVGISGSGDLFNVTYTGTFSKRYLLAIYADGSREYVYYNGSTSTGTTSTSSGSGSSAASSSASSVEVASAGEAQLAFSKEDFTFTVIINQVKNDSFIITNLANKTIVLELSSEGLYNAVSFPGLIRLVPGEERFVNLIFLQDKRQLLVGQIVVKVGGVVVKALPVVLNVRSENFLFDSSLTLADNYKTLKSGDSLRAQINLQQVGRQNEQVDVVATYTIKDFTGKSYYEESETFAVLGSNEFIKEIKTPRLSSGKYILALELVYPGAFATSSAQFEIVSPARYGTSTYYGIVIVFTVILVGLVAVVWWALRRRLRLVPPHKRRHHY